MSFLVAIAVGPVQDFIAAARRTRDLWYGSHLLSQVSKAVAQELHDAGAELIFPASEDLAEDLRESSKFAVVNKLLAIVDRDERGVSDLICDVESRIKATYLTDLLRVVKPSANKAAEIDYDLAEQQLRHIVEFYAAWLPHDEGNYPERRLEVEELLSGRKALRDFAPNPGRAGYPKSSLDGNRETVIRRLHPDQHFIKVNEELDGIGIIKRFSVGSPRFESTHDVAAQPLTDRLGRDKLPAFEAFKDFLKAHKVSGTGEFLYRGEPAFQEYQVELMPEKSAEFKKLRLDLVSAPRAPYYALMLADGDSMGAALRNLRSPGEHRQFSRALSVFSKEAAKVIEENEGEPIYTGGDDVLGLLPLHKSLIAAWAVREAFQRAVKDLDLEVKPTFSAGLAVAHAMENLSAVREQAKRAERLAKGVPGKDALAIIISPRSGADVAAAGKWDQLAPLLDRIVDLYRRKGRDRLSPGFAYELRNLVSSQAAAELDPVLFDLAFHIAGRKEGAAAAKEVLEYAKTWQGKETSRKAVERLIGALLVARPFARAKEESGYKTLEEIPFPASPAMENPV